MHISLNWLRTLVDFDLPPEDLAEKLTMVGFEVENIEDRRSWADGVVVGKVLNRDPHPNANKLSVCQVDIGTKEPSTIVCGAPNVAADQYVPVATLGTYLPTVDLRIKKAKLRGVASQGMICSLAELGLEKDSDGIHTFDPEAQELTVGADVRPLLGLDDVILDLTSTANRADALSMVGVAREVAALTGTPLTLPQAPAVKIPNKDRQLTVEIADPQACPAYIATVIKGVTIAPSPDWLQQRLSAAGIRPINNVVDITNYILLEWGQPLHAFDGDALAKIAGKDALTLGVRLAKAGETLTTLDSQERTLLEQTLVITANGEPIALGGVMGGEETEVRDTSTNLVLEAALFSAISVRRSARSQGLRTEASTRYERGVNPAQLDLACHHALQLLVEFAGGKVVAQQMADSRSEPQRSIELRLDRVNKVLGAVRDHQGQPTTLQAEQVTEILTALGFGLTCAERPQTWQVAVPPYRYRDIEREIDLIEEIARLHGYDHFCDTLPAKTELGQLSSAEQLTRQVRSALRAEGLTELIHYSWVKPGDEETTALVGDGQRPAVGNRQITVVNPLLVEFSALRTEMLTAMINACQYNLEQGNGPLNGFEIGRIFWREGQLLREAPALAGILGGDPAQGKWIRGADRDRPLSWYEAKGILEAVFDRLNLTVDYQADTEDPRLHPGRTASLWLQGLSLGRFGQLHPQLCQQRELPAATYGFELDLEVLLQVLGQQDLKTTRFQPYSTFPAMDRDLAFFVPTTITVAEIEQAIRAAAQGSSPETTACLLDSVELFDQYQGEHVPEGQRSLAFRLIYRAGDRTLTDDEVNPIHQQVRVALETQFQASLRS